MITASPRAHDDDDLNGHDFLGVLETEHAPNDQCHDVRHAHEGEERKAAVLRSRQVAVGVLDHHLPLENHGRHVIVTATRDDARRSLHCVEDVVNTRRLGVVAHVDSSLSPTSHERSTRRPPQLRSLEEVLALGILGNQKSVLVLALASLRVSLSPGAYLVGFFIAAGDALSVAVLVANSLKNILCSDERLRR